MYRAGVYYAVYGIDFSWCYSYYFILLLQLLIAATTYAVSLHYHSVNTSVLLCVLPQKKKRSIDVLHVETVSVL
jgi:hypothetical protein